MYAVNGEVDGRCMGSYGVGSPTGMDNLAAIVFHVPPHTDVERWDGLHAPAAERRTLTATCAACMPGERLLLRAFPAGATAAIAFRWIRRRAARESRASWLCRQRPTMWSSGASAPRSAW
jgi:hypothetical protein